MEKGGIKRLSSFRASVNPGTPTSRNSHWRRSWVTAFAAGLSHLVFSCVSIVIPDAPGLDPGGADPGPRYPSIGNICRSCQIAAPGYVGPGSRALAALGRDDN